MLADRIVAGRVAANLKQAELAAALDCKQQTISRWEAGTHRPAVDQVPALAAALSEDTAELMALAGYGRPAVTATSPLFPIDALDPAAFEQFIADLLHALYPEAQVQQQGARGHDQAGTDILVRRGDGRIWSFQCKRVERFGPADIERAVADHIVRADHAFLVLSRTASPNATEALQAHDGWTLWDKQDIARLVRSLPVEAQDRLVDIYFRGQRMALLGRSEPGPWLTADQYFAPFGKRSAVFSHDWPLVGRDAEIAALTDAVADCESGPAVLLTGPGGIGKTRIVKAAIERFATAHPRTTTHFLSATREPDRASLEALGSGTKLLVIDDAHDREGLGGLIEFAADERNKTCLLIATRPYAEQRIRNELALFSIVKPPTIRLDRLDKAALRSLVEAVLVEFGGETHWADAVLSVATDSPLVASMAARVIARDGVRLELARCEEELRQVILARFAKVITGNLGSTSDAPLLRSVLEVLAVIQPFHVDDRRVGELVAETRSGVAAGDVSRALKLLIDGGVIYKRGNLYRLMPDLLGDFLIEESCIGANGRLTHFAEAIAEAVDSTQLTQVLVNLGRMDWRREGGDPSASALLTPIWAKLRAIDTKYDPRIEAVQAVAIYQPAQALDFVQAQLDAGNMLNDFSGILRRVAMSPDHRLDALRLLWDLGRDDARATGPHPNHPIRSLSELVGYDEHKPLDFVEDVSRFAFGLLDEPDAWSSHYSPLDVLEPLLSGQGMSTHWSGRRVSLSPYFVDHRVVAHLRARVVDRTIELLSAPDSRTARRAAMFINNAIRAPYGLLNSVAPDELLQHYTDEFRTTFARIAALVKDGSLRAPTLIGLIHSLSWHAEYDEGELGDVVRDIFDTLPDTLDFRLHAALADGSDYSFRGQVRFDDWGEDLDWATGLAGELRRALPDPVVLRDTITEVLSALDAAGEPTGGAGMFLDKLMTADSNLARAVVTETVAKPNSRMCFYLGIAIGALMEAQPDEGRTLVATHLASPDKTLRTGAARALIGLKRPRTAADLALLRAAIGGEDDDVAWIAITAMRTWRDMREREAIDLALTVPFDREPALFDHVGMLLCSPHLKLLSHLTERDIDALLARMSALPRLEGHWAEKVLQHLADKHGERLAAFILSRGDVALEGSRRGEFDAIGMPLWRGHLGMQNSPVAPVLLRHSWAWLRRHDDKSGSVHYHAAEIFTSMFKVDSAPVVEFFEAMLDQANPADLRWIARVVRHGHHSFAFQHRRFVERFLARCKVAGPDLVKFALDQLEAAALSGGWSGTPGEPMPRDVKARAEAQAVLATLSRLAPAYLLYKRILEHAEANMEQSLREGQVLDEEE